MDCIYNTRGPLMVLSEDEPVAIVADAPIDFSSLDDTPSYTPYTCLMRGAENTYREAKANMPSCQNRGCHERALYNFPGLRPGRLCVQHRLVDMIVVSNCDEDGCTEDATFSYPGIASTKCSSHAQPGMLFRRAERDTRSYSECVSLLSIPTTSGVLPEQVEYKAARSCKRASACEVIGCARRAYYSDDGSRPPMRCNIHAYRHMISIYTPHCEFKGCKRTSLYNTPGNKRGIRCGFHRIPGDVNIRVATCRVAGCTTQASLNYPDETSRVRCSAHKLPGMVMVARHRSGEKRKPGTGA